MTLSMVSSALAKPNLLQRGRPVWRARTSDVVKVVGSRVVLERFSLFLGCLVEAHKTSLVGLPWTGSFLVGDGQERPQHRHDVQSM